MKQKLLLGSLLCRFLYPAADTTTPKSMCSPGRKYKNFESKNFNCEGLEVTYTSVTDVDKLLSCDRGNPPRLQLML